LYRHSELLGLDLVAHGVDRGRSGPNKDRARSLDGLRKEGVLRQKAVAGVHRLCASHLHSREDAVGPQIRVGRLGAADADGLARHLDVRSAAARVGWRAGWVSQFMGAGAQSSSLPKGHHSRVGLRVDGDGLNAEAVRGAHDTARNLAPVGDQDLAE